ncbi:unnamed protein product [Durusdinium trenchii]|uniref:HECT-type E3 ubiquitin transferase n=1 Tax=Durusdinium trenchii TaxID=1381693 RepID=A0ABP0QBP6_9DINO
MDEAWSCDRCTLINSLSSTTCVACGWQCAVPAPAPTPTAAECERAVEQIWNLGSLKALLTLVTNILDHPGEAKYLGPIKKSNSRINGSIVQVSGAAQVLHLAGFREDAEAFASAGDVVRLRRVQHALRKQQEVVQNSHGYKEGAVLSSKPRFDENLLREIHAEAQHQATLRGAPAAPATAPGHDGSAAPTAATSPAALRLRLRIPVGGSVEMKIPSETKVQAFQEEVLRLTGVKAHHQRLRFGFPSSKILKDDARSASLKEVGLQDGELLILEDLHDLFLGNLESGQFTMEEMLDKVPPSPEDGEDCTVTLFLDVLSAFEIESHSLDFWHAIRQRLREYFAEDQVGEMTKVSAGLKKLQQLFRHHDTRQRMQLILGSLPIRWKLHQSNKLVIQRSSFFESVARQVHSMNRRTMLTRLHISYQGEKGVDAGGLTRDFFASFARHMAEEAWLWRSTGRGSLHPTYGGEGGAGQMYQVCGRVFAMALLHGCKLGRPLSRPFMRLLLHVRPSSLQELQAELNYEAGEQVDFRCRKDFLERLGD